MNAIIRNTAKSGTNHTQFESGSLQSWIENSVEIPGLGKVAGKLFLKEQMNLTSCEISINALPPGEGMPFHHTHKQNEEIYIFLNGTGQVQIDNEVLEVKEGTILKIAPNGVRTWRNNGSEMLVYLVLQMKDNSLVQWGLEDADVPEKEVAWPK
ncbi:MAG: cupin domain-containing protein [Rhodomicrobiaceae bacterium]